MSELTVPTLRERLDAPSTNPFRHVPPLDGIRGLSMLLIMVGHYGTGLSDYIGTRFFGISLTIDLFFVLSGFLITSLLLEEWSRKGTINMRNFYVRRGLRLLPALYVLLGVLVLVALFTNLLPLKLTLIEAVAAGLYVYPVVLILRPANVFLFHLWTLSVEEWFYFIWPALLAFGGLRPGTARRLRMVVGGLVAFVTLCAVLRIHGGTDPLTRLMISFRPDSLFYGALLAIFLRKWPDWRTPLRERILVVLGFAASLGYVYFTLVAVFPRQPGLTTAQFHDSAFGSWNYQLGIWCATLLVLHVTTRQASLPARFLSFRPWTEVGLLSYGLYLWHQPIFLLANEHWYQHHRDSMSPWLFGFGIGVLAFAAAITSRHLVEIPALRLKKRFEVVHYENKR